MVSIVIPFHNQLYNVEKILHGISMQSIQPDNVIILLDRPGSDEGQYIHIIDAVDSESEINFITHVVRDIPHGVTNRTSGDIFLTPYIRNIGIEIAKDIGTTTFIFIDGDCIPQRDLVKGHLTYTELNIPMLTVGRRRESKHSWRDQREVDRSMSGFQLFRTGGVLINNLMMLKHSMIVWSCNISMNIDAINRITAFNKKYYDRSEVFSSMFNGTWGGEDAFLGIEAFYSNVTIHTLGDSQSGIKHIDHPRPTSKYSPDEHMSFFNQKIHMLGELLLRHPNNIFNLI